jgi:hypothetical protein
MTINRLNQGVTNQVLVKAVSGQTTPLLELQDSTGAVVSSIGPTGALGGTLGNSGLVHIETQTITGTPSAVSFNNVFSANFRRYKVIFEWVNSDNDIVKLRLRNSLTDDSSALYDSQTLDSTSTVNTGTLTSAQTSFPIANTAINCRSELTIWNPFNATFTHFLGQTSNGSGPLHFHGGRHRVSTAFDGFSFFVTVGTFTSGYITVYGYKD